MGSSFQKRISNGICLGAVLVILALLCFRGELYLSENGYLLLRHCFDFDNRRNENVFGRGICYDTVVNGEHIYIHNGGRGVPGVPTQFALVMEHSGSARVSFSKEDGKVHYVLLEPDSVESLGGRADQVYKKLEVVRGFFGECWKYTALWIIGYSYINEGRLTKAAVAVTAIVLLQAAPLLIAVAADRKDDKKYRQICRNICSLLQISIVVLHIFNYITIM